MMSACSSHLPTCLPTYLPTYLPIYLTTYLPACLPTYRYLVPFRDHGLDCEVIRNSNNNNCRAPFAVCTYSISLTFLKTNSRRVACEPGGTGRERALGLLRLIVWLVVPEKYYVIGEPS